MAARYDEIMAAVDYDSHGMVSEEDLLAALLVIRELKSKFDIDEARIIAAAREKKVTWQRLAGAMELRSRSSAERRFLQLSAVGDCEPGRARTQAERVEQARTLRSRRAEREWAADNAAHIMRLARQLALLPDLQDRAERAPHVTKARHRAAIEATRTGHQGSAVPVAWPGELIKTLRLLQGLEPGKADWTSLIHRLSGLLSHAADSAHIRLDDHPDLRTEVRALYRSAGNAAPRQLGRPPAAPRRRPVMD
ncbi:hypothetical protein AB0F11_14200 [Streptomyces sp. NPDC032472]|uniref:hypothetical protein n=1 Tax=Streptomyces sp. NPDC032472 TaxID=3155018 RepID=UPI0034028B0C